MTVRKKRDLNPHCELAIIAKLNPSKVQMVALNIFLFDSRKRSSINHIKNGRIRKVKRRYELEAAVKSTVTLRVEVRIRSVLLEKYQL